MPEWLGVTIAFIYGAIVGSFLNVCIWRMPREESIVKPGSHCPRCDTPLKASDLVPLFSFLIHRRRCRYCGEPISWRYFVVELVTGVYFGLTYLRFGWGVDTVVYALFGAAMIAVFLIDLEHYIIPDELSLFGVVLGIVHDGAGIAMGTHKPYWVGVPGLHWNIPVPQSVVGIVVGAGAFLAIALASAYVFKKEGMGMGDVKLAAAVGAILGPGLAMGSFFIAILLGSIIGVALIAGRKKSRKDYVPFGPFMVVGALVAVFFQAELRRIWELYTIYSGL